ncbi:E3 ubiquitin-protein ligase CHFR isoform X2 [Nematostella vectensis]|uniref:E3 ubiquitin-protein ligase CHFR isoform X2 n=1 Tax=Nematostella vectensis TaxID=45351 RepID=UPI0020777FB6|nr:E3 ubiquitin-protein ligase CHFR isoform X2 [Nematostella vectensis]
MHHFRSYATDNKMAAEVDETFYRLVYTQESLSPVTVSQNKFTLGRAQDCDLSFASCKYLSGHHCNITRDEDGITWLYDTSTNGTLVNGRKVKNGQRVQLCHNDEIHLVHRKDLNIGFIYQDVQCLQGGSAILDQTQEYELDLEKTPILSDDSKDGTELAQTDDGSRAGKRAHPESASTSEPEGPTPKKPHPDDGKDATPSMSAEVPKLRSQDSLAETLLCNICQDIFHDCISLQPCMHSFCASCYSQWMEHSRDCPSCRNTVSRINKNHIVNNLVEAYLRAHPDKCRSDEEIKEMDARNKITTDMLKPRRRRALNPGWPILGRGDFYDDDDDDDDDDDSDEYGSTSHSDDSDDDDDDDEEDILPRIIASISPPSLTLGGLFGFRGPSSAPLCRQCPSYNTTIPSSIATPSAATPSAKPSGASLSMSSCESTSSTPATSSTTALSSATLPSTSSPLAPLSASECCRTAASSSTDLSASGDTDHPTPSPYTCYPGSPHIICTCCREYMPDRRPGITSTGTASSAVPPLTCSVCSHVFCHLYWGCQRSDCNGCLNQFKDMKFVDGCLTTLINNNNCESEILKNCLAGKNIGVDELLQKCLEKLDVKAYTSIDSIRHNLTSTSVICYRCGLRNFQDLAYQYRRDIPADELPASVTSKPDCYWGKNCRTQKNKPHHASRFNHICEQTRFT